MYLWLRVLLPRIHDLLGPGDVMNRLAECLFGPEQNWRPRVKFNRSDLKTRAHRTITMDAQTARHLWRGR